MPSTIPAAMASAISGPLSAKTHSFFSLSGMLLDRTDENLPRRKLAPSLYDESQITVKCVTVSAARYQLRCFLNHNIGGKRPPITHIEIVSDSSLPALLKSAAPASPGLEPFLCPEESCRPGTNEGGQARC